MDDKAYLLFKDWRSKLKKKFVRAGGSNPYNNVPMGVRAEDWRHMIDVEWKDESHKVNLRWMAKTQKII